MEISWMTVQDVEKRIVFDASMNENHEPSAEATSFPIEGGANIADHTIVNRTAVSITGLISNTPIRVPETQMDGIGGSSRDNGDGAKVLIFDGEFNRVQRVYRELVGLINARRLVRVTTSLEVYDNCVLEVAAAPRSAKTGNAVEFDLEFKQILVANSRTVDTPAPLQPRGRRRGSRGSRNAQASSEGSPEAASGSLAVQGGRALGILQ